MQVGHLDCIHVLTSSGIEVKIYEDGLIVLSKANTASIKKDVLDLTSYYEEKLSPGISYIFSLGAPVPKELANIKTIYPYFVVLHKAKRASIDNILSVFQEQEYIEVKEKEFEVYRGNKLYIINNISESIHNIEHFIEEQIFIREFKGQ